MKSSSKAISQLLSSPQLYLLHTRILGGRITKKIIFREHLKSEPGLRVLDVGCGPATDRDLLGNVRWTGLDFEPRYVKYARKRLQRGDQILLGDVEAISKVLDDQFDLVLLAGVLHHLDDVQVNQVLNDSAKLLSSNGRIMTIDPVRTASAGRIEVFLLNADRGKYIRSSVQYNSLTPNSLITVSETVHDRLSWIPQATRVSFLKKPTR